MQASLIGRTLRDGEYLVREVLGRGGMATVYRAYSRSLETDVALKVLAPEMAVNLELRERFHQEARLLSRLFHPNLLDGPLLRRRRRRRLHRDAAGPRERCATGRRPSAARSTW